MSRLADRSEGAEAGALRHNIGGRRAYAVWGAAVTVYVLAVFHRTSLGVAGLLAADRFHISGTQLATFTVLQLLVYAAMQVPVGVLLDRFGSRRLILTGLALMTLGQLVFGLATSFETGIAARVLVGAGDAMVFVSVIRVVVLWFPVRRAPLFTQLSGQVGQVGAIAASFPLSAALHGVGWTPTFLVAAGLGVLLFVAVLGLLKDSPYAKTEQERIRVRALAETLRATWGSPGTHLGLWSHFTSQFGMTVFSLLWGFPFLVRGQGLSEGSASALLVVMTVTQIVVAPLIGGLVGRYPYRRSPFVLSIVGAIATVWAVVLLWPGHAPLPLLVTLVMVTAVGVPTSMVGFDLARSFNPADRMGSALGVVNVGGFTASLAAMALIGFVLDKVTPGGPSAYTTDGFRVAMAVQFPFWALGALQIWRYRRKSLGLLRDHHPDALQALRDGESALPGISAPPR
jgi:MFS family permease